MDISDGEIKDDFSDISEEEYFDNIANKIEKRKLELELLNQIEIVAYDDYAKENRFENHRNRQEQTISRSNTNLRKEKPRKNSEIRNRSYRAPSIFSTSYTLPKRKRQRRRRKYTRPPTPVVSLSSSDDSIAVIIKNDSLESDEDEELLALRLQALTSKQEVKELIVSKLEKPKEPVPSPVEIVQNEEEQLRIAALRSAILKRKDHFRKRKQQKKIENERPYSPSDSFEPIIDNIDLSNSPLGSPFHETTDCDINEEVDMDISTSPGDPAETFNEANHQSCEMDIVTSPQSKPAEVFHNEEDEDELRSMLLSSINDKKKDIKKEKNSDNEAEFNYSPPTSPPSIIAKNLKLAVERLRQQKQLVAPIVSQKSGTKTIKMILEEQKHKKISKDCPKEIIIPEEDTSKAIVMSKNKPENNNEEIQQNSQVDQSEVLLIDKISNNQLLPTTTDLTIESRTVELADSSFSTITDTKNIPLLPETKKIDKRLVTVLESVIRPVTPLVISLGAESSEDEYDVKKSTSKTTNNKNDFEKNLDNFLKNIRTEQEKSVVSKGSSSTSLKTFKPHTSPKTSAVKHLPLSSQIEYEKLLLKMKTLQEAKEQRQKEGTLKRNKSSTSTSDKSTKTSSQNSVLSEPKNTMKQSKSLEKKVIIDENSNKKESVIKSSKIDDTLAKIPLLDEAARKRLKEKTENNFITYSKNLLDSTETNVKLLEENSLEFKRREKIELKIEELEKTLNKYKNFLRIVNSRIKSNTPKLLQSQRDMIKLRTHQHKFGQICKKVGETVCGDTYRLPSYEESTIESNFIKISEKTEDIQKAIIEQPFVAKQLKLLSEKVHEFLKKPEEIKEKLDDSQKAQDTKEKSVRPVFIRTVSQLIASCNNEEEEVATEKEDNFEEIKYPEINRHMKRIMEVSADDFSTVKKKIKGYDSPLEFLKIPSTIIGNRKYAA